MTGLTRILTYIMFFISSSQLTEATQGPIVALDYGSFQGNLTGDSMKFLRIPFVALPYVIPPFSAPISYHFIKRRKLHFAPPEA